jgi:hypothetical protein
MLFTLTIFVSFLSVSAVLLIVFWRVERYLLRNFIDKLIRKNLIRWINLAIVICCFFIIAGILKFTDEGYWLSKDWLKFSQFPHAFPDDGGYRIILYLILPVFLIIATIGIMIRRKWGHRMLYIPLWAVILLFGVFLPTGAFCPALFGHVTNRSGFGTLTEIAGGVACIFLTSLLLIYFSLLRAFGKTLIKT